MSSPSVEDVAAGAVHPSPAEAPLARPEAASGTRRSRDPESVPDAADVITAAAAARQPKPSADIAPVQADVVPAEPIAVSVQPKPHESATAVTSAAPELAASKRPPVARAPQPSKRILALNKTLSITTDLLLFRQR